MTLWNSFLSHSIEFIVIHYRLESVCYEKQAFLSQMHYLFTDIWNSKNMLSLGLWEKYKTKIGHKHTAVGLSAEQSWKTHM